MFVSGPVELPSTTMLLVFKSSLPVQAFVEPAIFRLLTLLTPLFELSAFINTDPLTLSVFSRTRLALSRAPEATTTAPLPSTFSRLAVPPLMLRLGTLVQFCEPLTINDPEPVFVKLTAATDKAPEIVNELEPLTEKVALL